MDRNMRKCVMDRKIVQLLTQNVSFNQISKQLKVGKVRVRKIQKLAMDAGYFAGIPLPPYPESVFECDTVDIGEPVSTVDRELLNHKEWIEERIDADWHLVTILEELPVKIGTSSFYRFIKRHQISKNRSHYKVIPEIINSPGEVLQLDWGKLKDIIDPHAGKKRTVWFLVGVMGFSRYMMVRLVWDNKTETTLNMIESMFNEMGGAPKRIVSDNPKCFSIEASKFEPVLNPAFERFCQHYNTIPEILPPYDPKKKGKVERAVPYVRRLFEAHGKWEGQEESQEYLDKKVKIANERKHGTTKLQPVDIFLTHEASELEILPSTSFEREEYAAPNVRKDGCVRFKNKYYSAGKENIGKSTFIIGNSDTVKIYIKGKLIETHPRIKSAHQSKSIKKHHLEPYEQIINDGNFYLKKAIAIGPNVKEIIEAILLRGNGFVDTRKIWGILSLDKSNSNSDIDDACKYALECDQINYRGVMSFLNLIPNGQKNIPSSKNNKFTRSMSEYEKQIKKDELH